MAQRPLRIIMEALFVFMLTANAIKVTLEAVPKIDPATLPTFQTSSQVFKVTDRDTVVLPCEVTNPGPYVLAWKRGIAVLSAGNVKVSPDPRVSLVHGYSLEIKEVGPQDAGDYVCQIGTMEPREITHTVEILVPPRIHYTTSNGMVEAKKGDSVHLECKSSGNPVPKITWSRRNNVLPGGDQTIITPILNLNHVDRHQDGAYQCMASNGVGEDVTQIINLHVLFAPEISVERPVFHSGEGVEAQLVCIVHGNRSPEVLWYRDTMQLDTTERRIMETRGSRHTLIIRKVHKSDFGNYTCVADNPLGKAKKTVQLTGKPKSAIFNSAARGNYRDSYNISWIVESVSPIEEYKLLFRPLPENLGDTEDAHPQPLHHQSQKKFSGKENKTQSIHSISVSSSSSSSSYGFGRSFVDHRLEWRDVILPANMATYSSANTNVMQGMSYLIRGLDPAKNYEAKVQSRNRYGWSPVSELFSFETTNSDLRYSERSPTPQHTFNDKDKEIRDYGVSRYNGSAYTCSSKSSIFIFFLIRTCIKLYFTVLTPK